VSSPVKHHADPFDRPLKPQARSVELTIVTSDKMISRYDVSTILI
jgi:PIN domain nuclease of toxin-antitoxin system